MRVDVTIGEVVDDAPGGAHDADSEHEDDQHSLLRPSGARNPQRPQRGPQQQPGADGTIEPRQMRILFQAPPQSKAQRRLLDVLFEHELPRDGDHGVSYSELSDSSIPLSRADPS